MVLRRSATAHGMRWLACLALAVATPLCAQDERPDLSVPEPARASGPAPTGPFYITAVEYNDAVKQRDYLGLALPELIDFLSKEVQLEARILWNSQTLYSQRLSDATLLYMTGHDAVVRLNDDEKRALGQYLRKGGLLYAEDVAPLSDNFEARRPEGVGRIGTPFDRQLKALIQDPLVLGSQGRNWKRLPKHHPIYTAYFPFLDGPPLSGVPNGDVRDLEAIEIRGRTAVIFSDLNISWLWANIKAEGRERNLQFGVNLVVFALAKKLAGRPLPIRH